MKQIIAICLMMFGMGVFAHELAPLAGQFVDDKYYVEPGTIHVAPNSIFLNLEGHFVPVESVSMDDCGVYCLLPNCSSKSRRDWKCPREDCGTWNGAWRIRCQRCGHPRPAGSFED